MSQDITSVHIADVLSAYEDISSGSMYHPKPFVDYVRSVCAGWTLTGQHICDAVILRVPGSPVDLLVNGFLLQSVDVDLLQYALASDDGAADVHKCADAYYKRAQRILQLAEQSAPGVSTTTNLLYCAYYVSKADVLLRAFRVRAPVDEVNLRVRTRSCCQSAPTSPATGVSEHEPVNLTF